MSEEFVLTTFRPVFAVNSVIILIRSCILKHMFFGLILFHIICKLPTQAFQNIPRCYLCSGLDILWNFLSLNPLIPKSDKVLISPYNNTLNLMFKSQE